jgi:hypothetical protein
MDFFSRGYTALRGERGQPQSADETIEKLADCLETATLLEDRRAGVLSLKGLVRDWPEVGYLNAESARLINEPINLRKLEIKAFQV